LRFGPKFNQYGAYFVDMANKQANDSKNDSLVKKTVDSTQCNPYYLRRSEGQASEKTLVKSLK